MYKKIILVITILIIYLIFCHIISTNINKKDNPRIINSTKDQVEVNDYIGKLIIKKLNIDNYLYPINNTHNNIEENITILEGSITPENDNSIMFLAAHSGVGKIAFFKNLDKLNKNDKIILLYKNKTYTYVVTSIWEENKNGYIHVNKAKNKQLILTTCSPTKNNKQLIINSILKGAN